MSKIAEIAYEIECALDDGLMYEEIAENLAKQYGFTFSEAMAVISGAAQAMDEEERRAEIAAEASAEF